MKENDIKIITAFPRIVREIENTFIPLAEGINLAARIWLPKDAEIDPVPAILEFCLIENEMVLQNAMH